MTCPPNLSPLTLRHTTKAPLPLAPPIPIRSSCHKQIPGTTLCPDCLCVQGNELCAFLCSHISVCTGLFAYFFNPQFLVAHFLILIFFACCFSNLNAVLIINTFPISSLSVGMSHEPKSPSLGMISTATRTTATVSPLTPSPLNGSIVANGSPATQSAHSGFAAALRKLAKQAEEPRGKATGHCQV